MEIRYGREVGNLVERIRPDAVLSANTPTESQEPIVRACRRSGSRFFYWAQDFYSVAVEKILRKKLGVAGRIIGGYYRRLEKRQLRRSDGVVVITEDFKPIMVDEFGVAPERVAVIPNWAPIDRLPVLEKDNEWSRANGLGNRFCFLYTGTLGMKHNPQLLLELARHFECDEAVRVVVISEGIGAEWLRGKKKEHGLSNLLLLPYQPFESLAQVLASGDVLLGVLEEDAGVFSVAAEVLSYLCAARPLLLAVPEANLAARIVRQAGAGSVVSPSDTRGFVEAAEAFLHDREFAGDTGLKARIYAEKTFQIDRISARFEELLCGACG